MSPRRSLALAAAGFGVLLVLSFPGVLSGSTSFFARDFGVLGHPTVHYWRTAVLRGELPLWNPLSNCGVPFLAQWGTMALYPGMVLCLLPLPFSLNLFCLLHLWLGAVGVFVLARSWGTSRPAASVAGTVFAFSGLTQACLAWPNYCAALGWLPWVIWLTHAAVKAGGLWVPAAAIGWAVQILAGAPEVTLMTGLAALGFIGITSVTAGRKAGAEAVSAEARDGKMDIPELAGTDQRVPGGGVMIRRLLVVGGLALGLTAVQTLPFLRLLADSQRLAGAGDLRWGLSFRGLADLVFPMIGGFQTPQGAWFQADQQFFASTYLGLPSVGLALLAVWAGDGGRNRALLGLGLLGLGLALMAPMLGSGRLIRFPVKFILLTGFAVALLAGGGFDGWQRVSSRGAKRALVGAALVAVLAALALGLWRPVSEASAGRDGVVLANSLWRTLALAVSLGVLALARLTGVKPGFLGAGLIAVLWADYRWHLPGLNPTIPAGLLVAPSEQIPSQVRQGEGRVFLTRSAEGQLVHSQVRDSAADYLGKRLAHWSHLNLLEGVPKVNGSATLRLAWQDEVQAALYATNEPSPALLDFLGVRWVSDPENPTEWNPRSGALPLVTAGQELVLTDPMDSLHHLMDRKFDPARFVALAGDVPEECARNGAAVASVEAVTFGANTVRAVVQADRPTWLVVAQTWHPGWRATVNGNGVPVLRANHAFQTLPIPAGEARVILRYEERWLTVGTAVTMVSLVLTVSLFVRAGRRTVGG